MEKDKESYEIQVTEQHIRDGRRDDCMFCPVAMAIAEQTPYVASVYRDHAWLVTKKTENHVPGKKNTCRVGLPESVQNFVLDFDHGSERAVPFSFKLVLR